MTGSHTTISKRITVGDQVVIEALDDVFEVVGIEQSLYTLLSKRGVKLKAGKQVCRRFINQQRIENDNAK